jgi:MazG family protein
MDELLAIMARLRTPQTGCPWDLAQDFQSLAPYALEEAYEVVDVIERQAWEELPDELGDLLFQVVFHAQIGREQGLFTFDEVVKRINDKLIRRHPHIFAEADVPTPLPWEQIKAAERAQRHSAVAGVLAHVPPNLPALSRAQKLGGRAARVGFDWPDIAGVLAKVHEELGELEMELQADSVAHARIAEELGDLLFSLTQLARHLELDAETSLRQASRKFETRFAGVEEKLQAQGLAPAPEHGELMESLWGEVKAQESTSESQS